MKAIINGKRFDTDTAMKIGEAWSGTSRSDFNWFKEELYQTKRSKRFFLAGQGGARTKYSRSAGQNAWTGGSRIIPLDDAEALEWAERYLDAETIEKVFPDAVSDA